MDRDFLPSEDQSPRALFRRLLKEQPEGIYSLAGCAKDGGEGPPPKTPPPPPPGSGDFRDLVERMIREILRGQMFVRVRPGSGLLGLQRSPVEFAPLDLVLSAPQPKRIFMVTFRDRSMQEDDESLPDLLLAHATHLRRLSDEGRLEVAAGYASGKQGLQIILADSKSEVEQIAQSDPLVERGYYSGFEIDELLRAPIGDC